jgi:hypothetical protein
VRSISKEIQSILPKGEYWVEIEKLERRDLNTLWRVETRKSSYLFCGFCCDEAHFLQILAITQASAACGVSPEVRGVNLRRRQLLLDKPTCVGWPSYLEDPAPYAETMHLLKSLHEKMKPLADKMCSEAGYFPFNFILEGAQKLKHDGGLSEEFEAALEKVEQIASCLKPWLSHYATLCHGDLHRENVLLCQTKAVMFIGFGSVAKGDPFFDLVQFSLGLTSRERFILFTDYLGGRLPSKEEQAHFFLVDLTLLMVIAIVTLSALQKIKLSRQSFLSQTGPGEEFDFLESSPLPKGWDQNIPDLRARRARCLLQEFLKRSQTNAFGSALDDVMNSLVPKKNSVSCSDLLQSMQTVLGARTDEESSYEFIDTHSDRSRPVESDCIT